MRILKRLFSRKRRARHAAPSWDQIEERWPSPGGWASDAARALDDELDYLARTGGLPRSELTGLPAGYAYWPVQQPADLIEEEPPAPELLDDLPEDAPHPHPSCCGRPQPLECKWLGERGYLCFTHDRRWHEAEERLARTGDFEGVFGPVAEFEEPRRCTDCGAPTDDWCVSCGEPVCSPCTATGHDCMSGYDQAAPVAAVIVAALDELDEHQLAEFAVESAGDRSDLDEYLDDLDILTRYRIPAGLE